MQKKGTLTDSELGRYSSVKPVTVHSGAGTHLVSTAKNLQVEDDGDFIDFNEVARYTVVMFFVPTGAQFRNGCNEACVKKQKHSLLVRPGGMCWR